jgi:Family of unknown function (DUF5372)
MRSPDTCFNAPLIAPQANQDCRRVQITHPFHPLRGKQFDLVEHRCIFRESYVYFQDNSGQLREIPAAWTDFVAADAFVQLAAGRSPLHSRCLLELAELVVQMQRES